MQNCDFFEQQKMLCDIALGYVMAGSTSDFYIQGVNRQITINKRWLLKQPSFFTEKYLLVQFIQKLISVPTK